MHYTSLGRAGPQVSRLALGTMNFGELTDETASFEIMDAALEAGINFFDTADVYGGPQSPDMEKGFGTSEEIADAVLSLCSDLAAFTTGPTSSSMAGRRPDLAAAYISGRKKGNKK
jgi:diketogulonate reductase-like aldo/keto reductase